MLKNYLMKQGMINIYYQSKIIFFNDVNSNNFDNWEFSTFDTEYINQELCPKYSNLIYIFK